MKTSVRHLVTLAMFTTMALIIFIVEAQIPMPFPIPGIKLGLSNIITLFILFKYKPKDALIVLLIRIFLGSLFAGQLVSFFYSLSGGLLCWCGMSIVNHLLKRKYFWITSIIGAILHNIGQITAAMIVMQSVQVIWYLPFLMLSGCLTGLFTGLIMEAVVSHCKKSNHVL